MSYKSEAQAKFGSRIEDIRNHMNANQVYVPWIQISISPNLVIDTASSKNYFVSLQNVKNSDGLANNTTIVIAYVPSLEVSNVSDQNINEIDEELLITFGKEIKFKY